jgi:hypothetical protein
MTSAIRKNRLDSINSMPSKASDHCGSLGLKLRSKQVDDRYQSTSTCSRAGRGHTRLATDKHSVIVDIVETRPQRVLSCTSAVDQQTDIAPHAIDHERVRQQRRGSPPQRGDGQCVLHRATEFPDNQPLTAQHDGQTLIVGHTRRSGPVGRRGTTATDALQSQRTEKAAAAPSPNVRRPTAQIWGYKMSSALAGCEMVAVLLSAEMATCGDFHSVSVSHSCTGDRTGGGSERAQRSGAGEGSGRRSAHTYAGDSNTRRRFASIRAADGGAALPPPDARRKGRMGDRGFGVRRVCTNREESDTNTQNTNAENDRRHTRHTRGQ